VIYDHFYGPSIEMHMAGITPDWVSRELIWACFDYPFNQLGVDIVFGPVPSTKGYVLDLDRRLGFVEHTRLKGAVPGGDLVILSMERHQCRWLNRPKVPAHG
jgi:hypothetical protein